MEQAAVLRKLSGIKRLEQAFKLSDFVRELSRKNITKGKRLSRKLVQKKLRQRLEIS